MIGLALRLAHGDAGDVEGRRLVGLAHVAGPFRVEVMAALHAGILRFLGLVAAVARVDVAFEHQFAIGERHGVDGARFDEPDRRALHRRRDADLVAAHRQYRVVETGAGKQRARRRHAEAHGDRHRLIFLVIFVDHLPHVRAGRNLERADIAPAEIHAVVAEVGAALELRAGDAADAGADGKLGLVGGVADRHHPFVDVVRLVDDEFLARRLALRDLHRRNRMRQRVRQLLHPLGIVLPAEHAVDDRHVAEQIGDDAMIGLALDVVEQHRTAAVHVLLQAGDLEVRIDFLVGLDQFAGGAQPFQRRAQIEGLVRRRGGVLFFAAIFFAHWLLHRGRSHCLEFQ